MPCLSLSRGSRLILVVAARRDLVQEPNAAFGAVEDVLQDVTGRRIPRFLGDVDGFAHFAGRCLVVF